jgi:hypothetical protein
MLLDQSTTDPFADFDNLNVKEVRLRPSEEETRLQTNYQKASIVSIIIGIIFFT